MARSALHAVRVMLVSIERAQEVAAGRTASDYRKDWKFRYALERALEIVSEASRTIPDEVTAEYPLIDWKGVHDIGNVLRHAYDNVSGHLLLGIVQDELPGLQHALFDIQKKLADDIPK